MTLERGSPEVKLMEKS